jgi:hypothetical protein
MTAEGCRDWRQELGAYTLGRLDPGERAALEAHLAECADCRAEAESLAPLSHLLSLADPSHLDAAPAPPERLGRRVAAAVAGESRVRRRRRRTRFALAGATATVAAVIVALAVLGGGGDPSRRAPGGQRVSLQPLPPGAAITARVEPRASGTAIRIAVEGLRSGTLCRVFLRREDGGAVAAGSFRYSSEPGDDAVLMTSMPLAEATALVMRAGPWTYTARLR